MGAVMERLMKAEAAGKRAWWIAIGLTVVLGTLAMRASVNFGTEIPPGMDAAYYPAQTRWLMERGRLMYNDLPLYFVAQAAVTRALMLAGGMAIDEAALLASRAIDTASGALLAIPIMLLGRRWAGGKTAGAWGALGAGAAAMVAVLSLPAYRMVSDFQKNTLGLVWMAAAVWAVHAALSAEQRGRALRWWLLTGGFVVLASLTHIGAAGATLLAVGVCVGFSLLLRQGIAWRTKLAAAGAAVVIAGLALAALYAVEPSRAMKLINAPAKLLDFSSDMKPRPGGLGGPGVPPGEIDRDRGSTPRGDGTREVTPRLDRPGGPAARGGRQGPGRPGAQGVPGGPGGRGEQSLPVAAYGLAMLAILKLWIDRRAVTAADRAVVLGCAMAAMMLAFPFISGEYRQRLMLMSPVPAAIACAFVLGRLGGGVVGSRCLPVVVPSAIVAAASLASLAQGFQTPHPPIVTPPSLAELRTLREKIDDPANTLIVARHGLEWWAAYVLNTPVRLDRVPEDAFARYDRVLVIQDVRAPIMPGGGMRGGPPRGGRNGAPVPDGFGPPPMGPDDFDELGGPPGMPPPDGTPGPRQGPGPRAGLRGPGPPGMRSARAPRGSRLIHEGDWYRVFEVPKPAVDEER